MAKFIDVAMTIYQDLLDFETEKAETYNDIEELAEFLKESNLLMEENFSNLKNISESLSEKMDNISADFLSETETMLEELENLATKIDDFIVESEELTTERKEEVINLVDKMNNNNEKINDSLEELQEVVNQFNETVTEIKPPLESKFTNTQTFIKDVMVRGLQNYQNIMEDSQENLDYFYQDNVNNLIEEERDNITAELEEFSSEIEDLTSSYQDVINKTMPYR